MGSAGGLGPLDEPTGRERRPSSRPSSCVVELVPDGQLELLPSKARARCISHSRRSSHPVELATEGSALEGMAPEGRAGTGGEREHRRHRDDGGKNAAVGNKEQHRTGTTVDAKIER